ncbi:MAG TPA: TraR/DksA C4-type zinc finger protein [Rhodocyclaceae bacterium]|nr:TraR/DksA C4-type zinc finger protein [Rhodocyclaceae bacterium]
MDILDRAQEREEEMRSDALAELARRADGQPPRVSALYCECGEEIPEARRRFLPGVQTCIECQRDIEKRAAYK